MTEQKQDRPAALTKRPIQPAPDEKVDPVDAKPPAKRAAPKGKVVAKAAKDDYLQAAPKQREVVFPLSTRMGELPTRVLEAEVRRSGKTVRVVVEEAVMIAYGQEGGKA